MNNIKWYFYLHTNGDVIGKNPIVVDDEYFNSPFVRKVWAIRNKDDFNNFILESRAMGANPEKLKKLEDEQS